jgi:hypothetical protein
MVEIRTALSVPTKADKGGVEPLQRSSLGFRIVGTFGFSLYGRRSQTRASSS